jgi:hypothetical protein
MKFQENNCNEKEKIPKKTNRPKINFFYERNYNSWSFMTKKKVFDFDLKKMPKTETSNTTCIAKKNKAKPYVDFCQNTYRYKNIHSGTNLFKTKKKQRL